MHPKNLFHALLFVTSISTSAQFTNLVAKTEKAILQLYGYDEYGSAQRTGTGFIIKPDGTCLTSLHVLNKTKFAFASINGGELIPVDRITRICEECDMAEFQLHTTNKSLPFVPVNRTIPPKASDIFVIGNPEGYGNTVSTGIISNIRAGENKLIQVSAPVSSGSSGSPIMDMDGKAFALVTSQQTTGQNLNFGYPLACMDKLKAVTDPFLSTATNDNIYLLNRRSKTQSGLILNSIEVSEKNTVVNMTYINMQLTYGDDAFIYSSVKKKEEAFYIEDDRTSKRYYIVDATLGDSPQSPTFLKLGEAKKFKLFFPPIKKGSEISIKEGMTGSDWSFEHIKLSEHRNPKADTGSFYDDFYFQTALYCLSDRNFSDAYIILKQYAGKNKHNDMAQNLAGMVSYIMDNRPEAYQYFKTALTIEPASADYYYNLYFMNKEDGELDEAIKNMSSAIQLNDDSPENYFLRGELYYKQRKWALCISDMTRFISSDRVKNSTAYLYRGISKLWLSQKEACPDLEMALDLEKNETQKEEIAEIINNSCESKKDNF